MIFLPELVERMGIRENQVDLTLLIMCSRLSAVGA